MMKLYFMRHAEAEDISAGLSDHDRKLTPKGVERAKIAAQVIAKFGITPLHIYTSPRVRALHTAEIVAKALGKEAEVDEAINFSFDVQAVENLIQGLAENDEIMFVGHEPSMSQVVGQLTGGNVVMKKGGMARVDAVIATSPLRGNLVWLIPPKIFDLSDE